MLEKSGRNQAVEKLITPCLFQFIIMAKPDHVTITAMVFIEVWPRQ